jgi:hypothetical protein
MTTHNQTASSLYRERAARIRAHLARIECELGEHEDCQRSEPTNWGYAGELGAVEAQLADIWEGTP